MKRLSIILFIAVLAFAFTATAGLAGPRHAYGYKGAGIIVKGNFPVKHVGFFSDFGLPPPPFFLFAPPKIQKKVNRNRYGCACCYGYHKSKCSHHAKYRKHQKRHRRDRHWDDYDDDRKDRSHRNRRDF